MPKIKEPTIIHIKLDEFKEKRIIDDIETGMSEIQAERQKIDFLDKIEANWDLYRGIIDTSKWGPWEGSANYHIALLTMHCDITAIKALRQTLGANPMILFEPEEEGIVDSELRDREDRLDYKLRKDINIEQLLSSGVYREACVQGTSFIKITHTHDIENVSYIETYTPEDIDQYKFESWRKHRQPFEKRMENIIKLEEGETIYVRVDEQREIYSGPKSYRVPLENLYLRPDIKDLSKQRLIAEKLKFTWTDIQRRLDIGYYYDEAVENIKKDKGKDFYKEDYDLFECILYADVDETGKFQRYMITYEPESHTILRAIHYPFRHGKICYIPYYIKPRDDSVYGYGLAELLKDGNKMIDSLWNAAFDRTSLANQPVIEVADPTLDLQAYDFKPNAWIPTKMANSLRVLETKGTGESTLLLMQMGQRFMEMASGVSAGQSGQESALDPRAPASKTAMLLEESNFRIEASIIELQRGNELLSEQVEELLLQYKPEDTAYFSKEMKTIDHSILIKRVRRIAHGTTMAINKAQELVGIERFAAIMAQLAPELLQMPTVKHILLKSYLDMLGGTLEKQKGNILPTPEEQEQMMMQNIETAVDTLGPEGEKQLNADLGK